MTAINAVIQPDRAFLMTDASFYDTEGNVVGFGMKAVAIPSLKAAIAVRGVQKVAAYLAMEMSAQFRDFDDLMDRADGWLPEMYYAMALHLADIGFQELDILIVGWSDRDGCAKGFAYTSLVEEGETEFETITGHAMGPHLSEEENANLGMIGANVEQWSIEGFDPVKHGIPIMEAQRRTPYDIMGDGNEIHIVGGHILSTEVTSEGITQRIIHRWDDVPGQPIKAEAFVAPSRLQSMDFALQQVVKDRNLSRQQRRALERRMKKELA